MIRSGLAVLRSGGVIGLARAVRQRLVGPRLECYPAVKHLVAQKAGLEIGGPTAMFGRRSLLPIYAVAGSLDNGNFSNRTVWEGAIEEGPTFVFDARHEPGTQYVVEAGDLGSVPSERYDFVASSHTLEHTANPLGVLREWMRVLKPEGTLVLVLPHKEGTFDHRRPVTTLEHLIDDYEKGTTEADLTHLPEILELHDLALDAPAGDFGSFKARSQHNVENRCLHHHVFDTNRAVEMVARLGLQIVAVEPTLPHHIFIVARKIAASATAGNTAFLGERAVYRSLSPFTLDRRAAP